jgi:hypothetical protein
MGTKINVPGSKNFWLESGAAASHKVIVSGTTYGKILINRPI